VGGDAGLRQGDQGASVSVGVVGAARLPTSVSKGAHQPRGAVTVRGHAHLQETLLQRLRSHWAKQERKGATSSGAEVVRGGATGSIRCDVRSAEMSDGTHRSEDALGYFQNSSKENFLKNYGIIAIELSMGNSHFLYDCREVKNWKAWNRF